LTCIGVDRDVAVELLLDERGALRVLRGVLGRPPVLEVAVGVGLAALVVEAVRHLVADDRAHAAVVDRVVGVGSKNGGCRIPAGNTISLRRAL
jgi:hypothetical protein